MRPHTIQETVSVLSVVLVKILTDQFKGLGPVVDTDNWRARRFRNLSLEVTLQAHETEDARGNKCEVPRPGDPDTVSDIIHR